MSQNVKREQRLSVDLVLRFPDINRNKSYQAKERAYIITVDGEPETVISMITPPTAYIRVRVRSLVVIKKVFRRGSMNEIDAIYTYRVGENFAKVAAFGEKKRIAISFESANILDVRDDIDFKNLKEL